MEPVELGGTLDSMTLLLAMVLFGQAGHLAPVSDEKRDPAFAHFVSKLKRAVSRRDANELKKLTDSDVIAGGFGEKDEKGWPKFAARWQVSQKDGAVWDVLADLLELGFFREGPAIYVSPYVAWKFPRELDGRDYFVILRDALPLRKTPTRDGTVLAILAFDIVKKMEPDKHREAFDWLLVETASGIRGYVQAALARSPLMARGQFALKNGKWKLIVLDRGQD